MSVEKHHKDLNLRVSGHCRDGSRVLIDYRAQFSGDKHPAAAGGGFQQAKRGRKAQRDAPAARATEATHEGGSPMGQWLTTHENGRRKKVSTGSLKILCVYVYRLAGHERCHPTDV